ncbi:MAG: glycosyltransferase [Fusobacterium mortiferum]|uniref:Glycosyltransferase n=1 Tax=Fusobacterium mortiferum TaxID=850 RepID=A0A414PZ97_FUSMR|nr:glycosyltransferase [Fusobacterium mortiferum]MCI7189011.1 glycosyltransferase [Fusobacterium mortiferum]RHF73889.1 glycosyltransferase [Fusobacterium mortiferum]
MENIKISVIIPVYNVEKYIGQCLDSIVNQTYKNLEIIIVNDGTKDNSMRVVEKYLSDKRIKIINKENGGLSSARNKGMEEVTGEYISFVDSDDWIELDTYERLIKNLTNEDVIIFNHSRVEDSTGEVIESKHIKDNEMIELQENFRYLYAKIAHSCWNKLYKTEYVRKNNFKFLEILYEDVFWNIQIIYSTTNIKLLNESFYNYRINRKGSIMQNRKNNDVEYIKRQEKAYNTILEDMTKFIENNKKDYSAGKLVYILSERENWRAKLERNLNFEEIDKYLREYFKKENNDKLATKILLKKVNETLKSKNVIKISGLNLFDGFYWKNGIVNLNLVRNRIKKKIKNIF